MDLGQNPYLSELDALSPGAKAALAMAHQNLAPQTASAQQPITAQGAPQIGPQPVAPKPPVMSAGMDAPPPMMGAAPPMGGSPAAPNLPVPRTPMTMSVPSPTPQMDHEQHLTDLETSQPGYAQVKNPFLKGLATVGNIASGFFPRIAPLIPGTDAHHNMLVHQAQGVVNSDESQANNAAKLDQEAAQTKNLESLPALHQAQLENAQTRNDLAGEKQHSTEEHQKAQTEATLRQHGYKTDETGKVVPLEYGEMSEPQQAVHDLKASQAELADANAAYAKAKKDNIPAQMDMAKARIQTAQQNAGIAARRLGLSEAQFNARNYGTGPDGQALPGSTIADNGKPVGSAFQQNVRPTGQERNKADLASSAHDQLSDIKDIVQKRKDIFGPVNGRTTDFNVWLGSQDPDAQRFRAARTIAGDHLASVFGGRSEAALKALDNAIGQFKDNPGAVLAGIDQLDKANTRFVNKGTPKTSGSNAAKTDNGTANPKDPMGIR